MRIANVTLAAAALLATSLWAVPAAADVKSQERTQIKFEGMLGRMFGLFGGKAARDGLVDTVALKGDRMMTTNGETGQIIDLAEEKVYDLDLKKKTYTVTTFDELRRRMREAQDRARQQAAQAKPEPEKDAPAEGPKVEIDFDMKETGQKRPIAGHECREVVATVTTREKGKTLEQGGGLQMITTTWLAPEIAALKERAAFQMKYAQKVYGGAFSAGSMEQMAAAMAMYPGMQDAIARMNEENVNMSGTPLLTTMTMQAVKSEEQVAQEKQQGGDSGSGTPTGLGGLMGGFAKKMAKKKESPEAAGQPANRATILTSTTEVLGISTDVAATDVAIPAGFRAAR
jgi:hypothetical protein